MENFEGNKVCENCNGTGDQPDGWTYEQAKADPKAWNDHRLEMCHGPNHGMVCLVNAISPGDFDGGVERCAKCHGSGESREFSRFQVKQAQEQTAVTRAEEAKACIQVWGNKLQQVPDGSYASWQLANKNIRRELEEHFPGHKFRVRGESFSMGNASTVTWEDGPSRDEVNAITGKYSGGHFDGMTDMYESSHSVFPGLFGSVKYLHLSRTFSDKEKAVIEADPEDNHQNAIMGKSLYIKREPQQREENETVIGTGEDSGIRMELNAEKRGVELYFPGKPDTNVRTRMKESRFRWNPRRGCWYAKQSEETLTLAAEIRGILPCSEAVGE